MKDQDARIANDPYLNRKAKKYTNRELLSRILWSAVRPTLFSLSPRPAFRFRNFLLRLFGAKIGKAVYIYPSTHIYYPWNLEIGNGSSIGEWTLIYNLGLVTIGQRVTISQRVHLCGGSHNYKQPDMPLLKLPICIEDDVWVCADAFIGPNLTLCKGCIIGAASVVMKDCEVDKIYAGNPALFVKNC